MEGEQKRAQPWCTAWMHVGAVHLERSPCSVRAKMEDENGLRAINPMGLPLRELRRLKDRGFKRALSGIRVALGPVPR